MAKVDDVLAGFYVADDGRVNHVDVTMSLAKGARMQGVRVIEGVSVTDFLTAQGAVTGVRTPFGDIEAEYVVNCAGMWARQLGEKVGVQIPAQAAEHYYLLTEPVPGVHSDLPVLEDPASYGYFREEGGGLMFGLFESVCAPWKVDGVPDNFSFGELPPDWDRMAPYLEKAMARIPISSEVGIKKFFCGPESFTPDLQPIVGEAPYLRNYFVAAGLNSIGILTGGGMGRVLAHWIVNGQPDVDVTGFHIDRMQPYQNNPKYRASRTVESLGLVYETHFPGRSPQTARGAKLSPIHQRLVDQGAYFKDVSGWESPDFYGPNPQGLGWGKREWFPLWEAEHRACREGVILMDMSFMSKFLVQGRDAGSYLDYLSANRVNGEIGEITYTQWLNPLGQLEADLTVTKLGEEKFWVVASDTAHGHVHSLLEKHKGDRHVFITDVTGGYAQINIQGPLSRDLLKTVTSSNLDTLPYRGAREIDLGFARVLCIRITYLGELGYELYIPAEQAVAVYDQLVEAGKPFGLKHAGLKALSSLRMEKAYRDYGHDIDNTDSVLEAGLGFAVALDKPDFIGRDAVLAKKAEGPLRKRLLQVLVKDPEPMMFHAEIVHRNGKPLGYIRAASYGHTLGGAVGLAMIEADEPIDQSYLDSGEWTVDIAGKIYPATVSLRPLYDPKNERIKA